MIRTVLLSDDGVRIRGYLRTEGPHTSEKKAALLWGDAAIALRLAPDGSALTDPDTAAQWLTVPDHPAYGDDVLLADAQAAAP